MYRSDEPAASDFCNNVVITSALLRDLGAGQSHLFANAATRGLDRRDNLLHVVALVMHGESIVECGDWTDASCCGDRPGHAYGSA